MNIDDFYPSRVTIGDICTFDCLLPRPDRSLDMKAWGGWSYPLFPRAAVESMVRLFDNIKWAGNCIVESFEFDDIKQEEIFRPVVIGGENYWPVGSGYWVWEEVSPVAVAS